MSTMADNNTGLTEAGNDKGKGMGGCSNQAIPEAYAMVHYAKAAEAAQESELVNDKRAFEAATETADEPMHIDQYNLAEPSVHAAYADDLNATYTSLSCLGVKRVGDQSASRSSSISGGDRQSDSGRPTPSYSDENQPRYMFRHRSRDDMFRHASHQSQGTPMSYQGHRDPRPYQSTSSHADYMGLSMRCHQFRAYAEMAYDDEELIDAVPAVPSTHAYVHHSRKESLYRADFNEDAGRPSRNLSRQQKRSSPAVDPAKSRKSKSQNPRKMYVESVDEDFDINTMQDADSEEELFVPEQTEDTEETKNARDNESNQETDNTDEVDSAQDSNRISSEDSVPPRRKRGRPSAYPLRPGCPEFKTSMAKMAFNLKQAAGGSNKRGGVSGNPGVPKPTTRGRKALWETHADPKIVDTANFTLAGKRKRGISKNKSGKGFAKEIGINNPENQQIVNLKDVHGWSFKKIAEKINAQRVENGGEPNQTSNSINCRYNRTAPSIFQVQGLDFIRITDRANARGERVYTKEQEALIWDHDMDVKLVELESNYSTSKWYVIAKQMQELTGEDWPTATEVATRFSHL